MKFFSTQLITLIITTTTLAAPLLEKRDDFEVSEGCKQAIKQYEECFIINNDSEVKNLDSTCITFKSEKCQNFKKNGYLLGLNECKNEFKEEITLSGSVLETYYVETKYKCTTDENGNICPINKYESENTNGSYEQALKDSCKSVACSNAYVEYVDSILKLMDSTEDYVKEKIDGKISRAKDKMKSKFENIKNPFDKRGNDNLNQSIKARRDYLVENKCATIGELSSDAISVSKTNTFIIAVILLIATLL